MKDRALGALKKSSLISETIKRIIPQGIKRIILEHYLQTNPPNLTHEARSAVKAFAGDLKVAEEYVNAISNLALESFLASGCKINIPQHENPEVSIILILEDRAALTLNCLDSILKSNPAAFEIIILDNAAKDETRTLLERIEGATICESRTPLSRAQALQQASARARGKYLLFLNNDAKVLAESLASALECIKSSSEIGAVGGKVIRSNGILQEAGVVVLRDGSCRGYGQGDAPFAPAYMFRREVDYCSADFLLTRRDLFIESGGFDEAFAASQQEDVDYCIRLWRTGKRVVYDPNVNILRYDFPSREQHVTSDAPAESRKVLIEKHDAWLQQQPAATAENLLLARRHADKQKRILFIEDAVPHPHLGAGLPRSHRILAAMVEMNCFVTVYPLRITLENWESVYADISREVEVIIGSDAPPLGKFIRERAGYYDLIFVSRPHNISTLKRLAALEKVSLSNVKIIYDAEALFCMRDFAFRSLNGDAPSPKEMRKRISDEVTLAEGSCCVISVSKSESQTFIEHGFKRVHTLSHAISLSPTSNSFELRQDILFVGPVFEAATPNGDSINWFVREIFPRIQEQLNPQAKLLIAGLNNPELTKPLASDAIKFLGKVDDLSALYNHARLFIAPTRFSAGVPLKIYEAAAHGLPVVASSLAANQLGWESENELLVGDTAENFAAQCVRLYQDRQLWNRLRANALKRVGVECSPESFAAKLKSVIEENLN